MDALARRILSFRWLIIITTLVITASAGFGLRFLSFNTDTRVFFSKQNPQLQALEALENTYTKDDNIFFVISSREGNIFTPTQLAAITELTAAAWQIPYSNRVDSISNFQHTRGIGDDIIVANLIPDAQLLSKSQTETIKNIALSEPQLVNRLIAPSGRVTGVNVNVLLPGNNLNEIIEAANFARELGQKFSEKYPQLEIYLAGAVMINVAFGEITQDDMSLLVPIMFTALVVIVGISLRSIYGTLGTLLVILFSMITALGIAGWFGLSLNPASANAPTIILTLAVADSVHILVTMFHRLHQGATKECAITNSLEENISPVFLTSITTVIGFLSMNFSDAPPFRELGNLVALGITAAFIYSIFFLPALMHVLPVKTTVKANAKGLGVECKCCSCNRLADFVIAHCKRLFWICIGVTAMLSIGLTQIQLGDDFVKYFSEDYEIRKASDFMEQNLTGGDLIEYSLYSGEPDGINRPDYLATIEAFANWYRQQNEVSYVSVFTDVMKRLNMNMHGDDPNWYRIPENRELAAQYLLLYEMSLPFGLDLNNRISVDKSSTRMSVILHDTSTRDQRNIEAKGRQWLKDNAPQSMYVYGSGLTMIWAFLSERNIKTMLIASFGALILISFILVFALRSIKYGLISLAPNLAPAVIAFGIWGILIGHVGLGLSVVVSMSLGIVVDDSVHFLTKYLSARREQGMSSTAAVRHSFNTVGTAMWITTLALVAGFLVLVFSGYRMNAEMGLMTAITISFALLMDFLFLPTVLMKLDENCTKIAA